jgi:hypothetical protein
MPTYIVYYNQGSSNGPFDIYLSGSSGLNLYASNIAKWQLVNGYQVTFPDGIPSSSVDVFDMSYGCFTEQNVLFPTPSPTVTPTITVTPSKTPTISITPSITRTASVIPTATPSVTPPPSATPSLTATPSVSATPLLSPTPTRTPSITRTPSGTPPVVSALYMGTISNSYTAAYLACIGFAMNRGYYTLPYTGLAIGSILYDNQNLTAPFIGNGNWIAVSYNGFGPIVAIQVNSSGLILDRYFCS